MYILHSKFIFANYDAFLEFPCNRKRRIGSNFDNRFSSEKLPMLYIKVHPYPSFKSLSKKSANIP